MSVEYVTCQCPDDDCNIVLDFNRGDWTLISDETNPDGDALIMTVSCADFELDCRTARYAIEHGMAALL